jgi:hypothetical protein
MHSECNNVAYHRLENKHINTMKNAILIYFFSLLMISPCLCVCLPHNSRLQLCNFSFLQSIISMWRISEMAVTLTPLNVGSWNSVIIKADFCRK